MFSSLFSFEGIVQTTSLQQGLLQSGKTHSLKHLLYSNHDLYNASRSLSQICGSVLPNNHTEENSPWTHQRPGNAEVRGRYKSGTMISKILNQLDHA